MVRFLLFFTMVTFACSDEPRLEIPDRMVCLERRDGQRYCIDVYEASREDATSTSEGVKLSQPRSLPDVLPWVQISWEAAREACSGKGKRLCELDEWVDACDGQVGDADGTKYTYGDTHDPARCNVAGEGIEMVGAHETCKSITNTYDQSGNVWEWTGNSSAVAAARGGGWRSSQTHGCKDTLSTVSLMETSAEIGFRCCRSE